MEPLSHGNGSIIIIEVQNLSNQIRLRLMPTWFAGLHLWQWRGDGRNRRGRNHLDFTPQNKPAERVIAEGFKK